MFSIDLVALDRDDTQRTEAKFAPDDPLWKEAGFSLAEPVRGTAVGRLMPSGQILVEGVLEGTLATECRRCTKDVSVPFSHGFTAVFADSEETGADDEVGEIRSIPAQAAALDLTPVVREELMLHLPAYTVCREECAGLCAKCGTDLNESTCECTVTESDPRWDALRTANL